MGCVSNFSKYILLFFNFVILVSSCLLIAYGVIYVNQVDGLNNLFSLGALSIAVGVITFVIAFFGCCGALRESSCLLTIYAIVLIVLLVAQIVLAILAFVKIKDEGSFKEEVTKLVQKLFDDESGSAISAFHQLQVDFDCCGVEGPQDYSPGTAFQFPKSCCEKQTDPCYHPFEAGCASKFTDFIENNLVIIGAVAIGFGVVELFGAIFAFMVRKKRGEYV